MKWLADMKSIKRYLERFFSKKNRVLLLGLMFCFHLETNAMAREETVRVESSTQENSTIESLLSTIKSFLDTTTLATIDNDLKILRHYIASTVSPAQQKIVYKRAIVYFDWVNLEQTKLELGPNACNFRISFLESGVRCDL